MTEINDSNKESYIDDIGEVLKATADELTAGDEGADDKPDWFSQQKEELFAAINRRNTALTKFIAHSSEQNKSDLRIAK